MSRGTSRTPSRSSGTRGWWQQVPWFTVFILAWIGWRWAQPGEREEFFASPVRPLLLALVVIVLLVTAFARSPRVWRVTFGAVLAVGLVGALWQGWRVLADQAPPATLAPWIGLLVVNALLAVSLRRPPVIESRDPDRAA